MNPISDTFFANFGKGDEESFEDLRMLSEIHEIYQNFTKTLGENARDFLEKALMAAEGRCKYPKAYKKREMVKKKGRVQKIADKVQNCYLCKELIKHLRHGPKRLPLCNACGIRYSKDLRAVKRSIKPSAQASKRQCSQK